MERFADQAPSASPLPWTVPTGAKNAFIYLAVSAGPSDFLFLGADFKQSYLLNYLLTCYLVELSTLSAAYSETDKL